MLTLQPSPTEYTTRLLSQGGDRFIMRIYRSDNAPGIVLSDAGSINRKRMPGSEPGNDHQKLQIKRIIVLRNSVSYFVSSGITRPLFYIVNN